MAILIDNFSMSVNEWVPTADLVEFSAEVTDPTHTIISGSTYFEYNDQIVSTAFSSIPNGYKISYSPTTPSGNISIVIHAESDAPETKEETYNFLFGYNVVFPELIDWGPGEEVVVWAEAKNTAFCPNTEGTAFYFETSDLHSVSLGASIQAVDSANLGATIYPQNTFFFYGRTYTVTISGVKDYAGNELPPYSFNFTIEDE